MNTVCRILFLIVFAALASRADAAAAYAVIDSASGHVLMSENGEKKLPVASLTKVATAIVALDWAKSSGANLNDLAVVPQSATSIGGVNPVGFEPGDRATVRDLIYAMLMQSDNVAAYTIAEHVGRTLQSQNNASPVDLFVAQMNALARRLGATKKSTMFLNPAGLDNLDKRPPYSTALDMARIARHAMEDSAFRFYVSQKERQIEIQKSSGQSTRYLLRNTNELLGVEHIDGVKTGMTRKAGECLILSSAKPPESVQVGDRFHITPRRLIVVVLGSANRFAEGAALLQQGWAQHEAWVAAGRPVAARK
jgi:D-alanyl-D-alanine carboxypeptidase (penicillin-binding protein 5/6)